MLALRHVDALILALALAVFLLAGFPMLGYTAGVVIWIAQRLVQAAIERKTRVSDDPKTVVGLTTGSMIGRGWLVALTIFGVGLVEEDAGLAAAVLFLAVFTVDFTVRMILRPFETPRPPTPTPPRTGGAAT